MNWLVALVLSSTVCARLEPLPLVSLTASPGAQVPERLSIPSPTELSRSKAKIRSTMEKDFELERSTVSQKQQLARLLLETAENTDDAKDRYALYVEAGKAAAAAGSVRLLDEAAVALSREYGVGRWATLLESAGTVETSFPWQEAEIAESLLVLADGALRANELDEAVALGRLAPRFAKGVDFKPLAALSEEEKRRIEKAESGLRRAQAKLAEAPDDPAANLVLGTFALSFDGDEEAGLDALFRSGVEALSAAAVLEREVPESSEELRAVAEAWERAARGQTSPEFRAALMMRAAAHLDRAQEGLAAGLEQKALAKRVEDLRGKARLLLRDPEGRQRDDQLALWKPKARVVGCRANATEACAATLAGVVVTSDEQWLEIELTETWTVRQGKHKGALATPKYLWRFERLADDPRTGRVTLAVRGAKLISPGDPNHRRNYGGTITIRGKTMAGDYRYDWTNEDKLETPPLADWILELD